MAWYWWVLIAAAVFFWIEGHFMRLDGGIRRALEELKELDSKVAAIEDAVRPPPQTPDYFADEARRKDR
jgi:hypothetical protein